MPVDRKGLEGYGPNADTFLDMKQIEGYSDSGGKWVLLDLDEQDLGPGNLLLVLNL